MRKSFLDAFSNRWAHNEGCINHDKILGGRTKEVSCRRYIIPAGRRFPQEGNSAGRRPAAEEFALVPTIDEIKAAHNSTLGQSSRSIHTHTHCPGAQSKDQT
jgi:hypothetical protein